MPDKNKPVAPITANDIANLTQAAKRLTDLLDSPILTKESDAEKAGLAQMIGNFMLDHAFEFIGAWNVLHFEYQPLIRGTAALFHRGAELTMKSADKTQQEAKSIITP